MAISRDENKKGQFKQRGAELEEGIDDGFEVDDE